MVMILWIFIYFKHQIVHLKYVQVNVYQLYLNRAVKKQLTGKSNIHFQILKLFSKTSDFLNILIHACDSKIKQNSSNKTEIH